MESVMQTSLETIISDFELLDEWEDRYRYIIDLGRDLETLPPEGCVSQVWLQTQVGSGDDPVIEFKGTSDADIVRGLVALVLAIYSGKRASDILATEALAILGQLELDQHLSPQRSNGLKAMVQRIKRDAQMAKAAHSVH